MKSKDNIDKITWKWFNSLDFIQSYKGSLELYIIEIEDLERLRNLLKKEENKQK